MRLHGLQRPTEPSYPCHMGYRATAAPHQSHTPWLTCPLCISHTLWEGLLLDIVAGCRVTSISRWYNLGFCSIWGSPSRCSTVELSAYRHVSTGKHIWQPPWAPCLQCLGLHWLQQGLTLFRWKFLQCRHWNVSQIALLDFMPWCTLYLENLM